MFDYSKLNGKVIEICKTQANFARKMGLSEHSTSVKLAGKSLWKQTEIILACQILNISFADIPTYFFVPKVQYN
ncbi:MAG: DUF739 family protein [Ruminococcus sp.]